MRIFSFGFAPKNWAACNGQLLSIAQNQALFSLLGTTYGGNGQTTFGLPDLRGAVPFHVGGGLSQGQRGGTSAHTLVISEMPAHNHNAVASTNGPTINSPANASWASNTGFTPYGPTADSTMLPGVIANSGGSQPHYNMAPYLVLNICIALSGVFPSRN